jgi:serine protease Do
MKRFPFFSFLSVLVLVLFAAPSLPAQQTKSPQIVQLFRDVVAKPRECTVRILVAGKEAALGTIVSADGWILTKHSVLKAGKITCRLPGVPDGEELDAELVGFDVPFDLAMLKVAAKDLTPVVWSDSKVSRVGHWVASPGPGKDPVAIGVISVAARAVKVSKFLDLSGKPGGYLGVQFDLSFAGVKVEEIVPNTPAHKAGLQAGDQILTLNGAEVESSDDFRAHLSRTRPGDEVKLKILRDHKEQELKATLGQPPGGKGGKSRGQLQNSMGSKLSERRAGFPFILQHDSVLKPADCGGPLVNLDGQVLGINIARAGRTESYAIPSEAVRPLLEKLKTAKADKSTEAEKNAR